MSHALLRMLNFSISNIQIFCIELIRKNEIFDKQITFLRKLFGRWAIFLKNIQQMGVIQVFNNNGINEHFFATKKTMKSVLRSVFYKQVIRMASNVC